jgi:hypothetical protein
MKTPILTILLLSSWLSSVAQLSKKDTVLSLYFDKGKHSIEKKYKYGILRIYKNDKLTKFEHSRGVNSTESQIVFPPDTYIFNSIKYYGEIDDFEFTGLTYDGYNKRESIEVESESLVVANAVKIDDLEKFLQLNYKERNPKEYIRELNNGVEIVPTPPDPLGVISYWSNLKHIYIVERHPKNSKKLFITEVLRVKTIE